MITDDFNNLSKLFIYENEDGDKITFNYGGGFLINKPEGIDTLTVNLSKAQGIDQTGATIQSKNIQPRPVTINGYVVGDNQDTKKDLLLSVFRPDLEGKLYGGDYYLNVVPTSTPTIGVKKNASQFQLSLLAAYPYWCKDESTSATLTVIEKRFKLWSGDMETGSANWKIKNSYRFGEAIRQNYIYITNSGQVPVPYTVTFSAIGGNVVNPKLIDANTNKYLLLNKTIVAGESVVVQITHERTYVTSTVDGECRGALDLASSFNRLVVGDNVIKPDATSGKSVMGVSIEYATEIVGVSL